MRLRVLASGSSGNGYILYNDKEALVVECGVPYHNCLKALDFRRDKIVGAVVSHVHGDHAKYVGQYLEAFIPVYTSEGTANGLKLDDGYEPTIVKSKQTFVVGGFKIFAFDTQHDCKDPMGFLIYHEEMGLMLFATDTYYLKYKFGGLNHIMIECNYCNTIIDKNVQAGVIPSYVRNRVIRSHMSLATTISTLKANDMSKVNNIVLIHLSSKNADHDLFKTKVEREIGKLVTIARPGVDIAVDKEF